MALLNCAGVELGTTEDKSRRFSEIMEYSHSYPVF